MKEEKFCYLLKDSLPTNSADSLYFVKRKSFFFGENSVFWHRGYVESDTLKNELQKVLKYFKSNLQVVAHTPVESILASYDGKIIAVDLRKPATEMLLLVRKSKKRFNVLNIIFRED